MSDTGKFLWALFWSIQVAIVAALFLYGVVIGLMELIRALD